MSSEGAQQNKTMTTFSALYYHIVWSTKNREKLIHEWDESHLYKYMVATCNNLNAKIINVNGMADHIHMLICSKPSVSIPDLVRNIKVSSTKMMRQRNIKLNKFEWQDSYGVFTVSKSLIDIVNKYIDNQKIHHQKMHFEEELITLLKYHEVSYDDKYVFG